jgi:alcohol dehydrogenase class IV
LNTALRQKQGYNHPELAPVAIVFDPALAAATPARLWFSAAVRTLDHGAEGYLSPDVHGRSRFAKLSIHDDSKVKIAPVHSDFWCDS